MRSPSTSAIARSWLPADEPHRAHRSSVLAGERAAGLPGAFLADHFAIERIAFDRDTARLGDQAADLGHAQLLWGIRAGVVIDLLVDDGAVDVVGSEAESDLGGLDAEHHPVRLDVRE